MTAPPPPRRPDFLAAFLSYLLPGLGQVLQGRIGKGLLFFVALYGLFFYGMAVGGMRNVWLPDADKLPDVSLPIVGKLGGVPKALSHRPQFLGQFWIGLAAWPAVAQYVGTETPADPSTPPAPARLLGRYMQTPSEADRNALQRDSTNRVDLGWVYTVIAGVLNLLVIYDALAGPAVRTPDPAPPAADPPVAGPLDTAAPVPAPVPDPVGSAGAAARIPAAAEGRR